MKLPYNRPWLMEFADHPNCPSSIRIGVQNMLTFLWLNRIIPFQSQPPYILASDVLEDVIKDIEYEEEEEEDGDGGDNTSPLRIIDFCSGAGGPIEKIERRMNSNRISQSLSPISFLLTDIHPPISIWEKKYGLPPKSLSTSTPTSTPSSRREYSPTSNYYLSDSDSQPRSKSISYIPDSVDATNAPIGLVGGKKHLRTFFLSFHHFNEELARGVLVDAMRGSEGICIFELQQCDIGSLIMIAMLGPLSCILTPFTRPSLITLFFTYIIPLIPLVLVIDGWISVYRTRPVPHVLRLANLAALSLQLEGEDKGDDGEWKWEYGTRNHTWPWGKMLYIIGRKRRINGEENEETDSEDQ
ncbi:uncharacterized protein IL334_002595 [Kwoniella shivajii]|uniref:Uncharacterized protein n=1 Tax=Kwoniella shivajii TaxID=564305 RepID=A0ABZ1CV59_9TREE|nr:hypothetical protein IL334_002595 [Kwoniella shivajii]